MMYVNLVEGRLTETKASVFIVTAPTATIATIVVIIVLVITIHYMQSLCYIHLNIILSKYMNII